MLKNILDHDKLIRHNNQSPYQVKVGYYIHKFWLFIDEVITFF